MTILISMKRIFATLLVCLVVVGAVSWFPQTAHAAGDASFILSPSSGSYTVGGSFTLTIYETSQASDNVAGVQANLGYNASDLQCTSVSVTGTPFTYLGQDTCSSGAVNIGEASGSTVSGQQLVGSVSFTVLAAGSASVSIAGGSDIQNSSSTSVWNGVNTSASYTLVNPPTSGGGGGTSGGSSGAPGGSPAGSSSSNKSSGSSAGKSTSSSTPTTSITPATTTTPTPTKTATPQTPVAATPVKGNITITVTDNSGQPIKNAKVVVDNQYSEYTNSKGIAGFSNLGDSTYAIVITAPGKKPLTSTVAVTSGQTKQVSLKLASNTSPLLLIMGAVLGLVILGGAGFGCLRLSGRGIGGVRFSHQIVSEPAKTDPIIVSMQGSSVNTNTGNVLDKGIVEPPTNVVVQEPTVIQPQQPPTPPSPPSGNG